jgi:RNA polymerase sigma-70 factor (ECF subfamily)
VIATRSARADSPPDRTAEFEGEALPHLEKLYSYALRLTRGDSAHAEDLVQEAMLSAFRGWHTFRPGTNCRAWLLTILRNHAMTGFRNQARRPPELDVDEVGEYTIFDQVEQQDPEGRFFSRIVDADIIRAIDELPDTYREALVLSDLEGLVYAEIAEITGVALGTVKSRLFRARQILQKRLHAYAVERGYLTRGPRCRATRL